MITTKNEKITKLDFADFKRIYKIFKRNSKVLVCNSNINTKKYYSFVKSYISKEQQCYVLETKPTIYVFQMICIEYVFFVHFNEMKKVFEVEAFKYV